MFAYLLKTCLNFDFPQKHGFWNFLCCDSITFLLIHVKNIFYHGGLSSKISRFEFAISSPIDPMVPASSSDWPKPQCFGIWYQVSGINGVAV